MKASVEAGQQNGATSTPDLHLATDLAAGSRILPRANRGHRARNRRMHPARAAKASGRPTKMIDITTATPETPNTVWHSARLTSISSLGNSTKLQAKMTSRPMASPSNTCLMRSSRLYSGAYSGSGCTVSPCPNLTCAPVAGQPVASESSYRRCPRRPIAAVFRAVTMRFSPAQERAMATPQSHHRAREEVLAVHRGHRHGCGIGIAVRAGAHGERARRDAIRSRQPIARWPSKASRCSSPSSSAT